MKEILKRIEQFKMGEISRNEFTQLLNELTGYGLNVEAFRADVFLFLPTKLHQMEGVLATLETLVKTELDEKEKPVELLPFVEESSKAITTMEYLLEELPLNTSFFSKTHPPVIYKYVPDDKEFKINDSLNNDPLLTVLSNVDSLETISSDIKELSRLLTSLNGEVNMNFFKHELDKYEEVTFNVAFTLMQKNLMTRLKTDIETLKSKTMRPEFQEEVIQLHVKYDNSLLLLGRIFNNIS